MLEWLKKHSKAVVIGLVIVGFLVYLWGCEPKTPSLMKSNKLVNRQELQLELDQVIGLAQLRMADLDKQEQIRAIILQNALVLVQGQPFNPVGLITAIAAIYGLTQGGSNIRKVVKDKHNKRKGTNGTG
jgi:predicted AAA+ superfamily ATPase